MGRELICKRTQEKFREEYEAENKILGCITGKEGGEVKR